MLKIKNELVAKVADMVTVTKVGKKFTTVACEDIAGVLDKLSITVMLVADLGCTFSDFLNDGMMTSRIDFYSGSSDALLKWRP